jgi:hypothetical protein
MPSVKTRRQPRRACYQPPVGFLLTLGHPGGNEEYGWYNVPLADYAGMGLGPEHADELLRMARDRDLYESEGAAYYGPVHACRALGALRITAAIPSLLDLARWLERECDDCRLEDMANVLAALGEEMIEPVARILCDQREPWGMRIHLCDALANLALAQPQLRARAVAVLADLLRWAQYMDVGVNSAAVDSLVELSATEALPAIRATYLGGYIDPTWAGTLEHVEEEIALAREEREARHEAESQAARKAYAALMVDRALDHAGEFLDALPREAHPTLH